MHRLGSKKRLAKVLRGGLATFGRVEEVLQGKRGSLFFGRGKLMLTGEYLVLDGAQALAVPTRLGQQLHVELTDEVDVLHWVSFDARGVIWVEEAFSRKGLGAAPPAVEKSPKARLGRLLHAVFHEHPRLWPRGRGLRITSTLQFDRAWGLGSSATLAYCLAAFAGTDAYRLNKFEFGGSGYDIATANAEGPLLYRLRGGSPEVEPVTWQPTYLNTTYLVHLGNKQDSRTGIADYRAQADGDLRRFVEELDDLTQQVLAAATRDEFADALRRHEALVGYVTHQQPLGRARFADFPGVAKSLGAWGGDFALLVPEDPEEDVPAYAREHGCPVVFRSTELLHLPASGGVAREKPFRPAHPSDWLVFLYGPLSEPRVDNEWLAGHRHAPADLLDFSMLVGPVPVPIRTPGRMVPGTVVYLSPDELRQLDLHPEGRGYRRTQVWVQVAGQRRRALVWLPSA